MEQSYPFDTGAGANVLEGEWQRMARLFRNTGVVVHRLDRGGMLNVTADGGGMYVNVADGYAFVEGFTYHNDAAKQLPIGAADATNPRVDLVVLRLDRAANKVSAVVLQGTPAASPASPALSTTNELYDLRLAQVTIPAAAGVIRPEDVSRWETHDRNSGEGVMDVFLPASAGVDEYPPGVSSFPCGSTQGWPVTGGTCLTVLFSEARGFQMVVEKATQRVFMRDADQSTGSIGWGAWRQTGGSLDEVLLNRPVAEWPEGVSASFANSANDPNTPIAGSFVVQTTKHTDGSLFQVAMTRDATPDNSPVLLYMRQYVSAWGPWAQVATQQDFVESYVGNTDSFTSTSPIAPTTVQELAFTAPLTGKIAIALSAASYNANAGYVYVSYEIVRTSDNVVVAPASGIRALSHTNTAYLRASHLWFHTVQASAPHVVRLRVWVSAGTGYVTGRYLHVIPL